MRTSQKFQRVDIKGLKMQIMKKLGRQKAKKYFFYFTSLLSRRISSSEFEKFVRNAFGKQDVALHNMFVKSILHNACNGHAPPSKDTSTDQSQITALSNRNFGGNLLPSCPPPKGVLASSRDLEMLNGAIHEATNSCDPQRSKEHPSAVELVPIGSKVLLEVASVEDGEEVEQISGSPCVQSRTPIRAPLGVSIGAGTGSCKSFGSSITSLGLVNSGLGKLETCRSSSALPDTKSLRERVARIAEREGLGLSQDCANLLNMGLDIYLKRLIRPCLELARSRRNNEMLGARGSSFLPYKASMLDFRVATEANPRLLGGDWPTKLEDVCMRELEI